mmetsp:Transcript_4677/g.9436  ORF Transcript_4677/g.9436 Transcript_4677/m.9436 type:complete len:127 (-) Transcript_4677:2290-2670(-)
MMTGYLSTQIERAVQCLVLRFLVCVSWMVTIRPLPIVLFDPIYLKKFWIDDVGRIASIPHGYGKHRATHTNAEWMIPKSRCIPLDGLQHQPCRRLDAPWYAPLHRTESRCGGGRRTRIFRAPPLTE